MLSTHPTDPINHITSKVLTSITPTPPPLPQRLYTSSPFTKPPIKGGIVTKNIEVKASATVDTDDMLSEIHDLKKLLMEQKNVTEVTFAAQQKQIEAEKTRNDQQQTAITEQQTKIDSLNRELSLVSHVVLSLGTTEPRTEPRTKSTPGIITDNTREPSLSG